VLGRIPSWTKQTRGERSSVGGLAGRGRVPDQAACGRAVRRITSPGDRPADVVPPVPAEAGLAHRLWNRVGHGEAGQTDAAQRAYFSVLQPAFHRRGRCHVGRLAPSGGH